jgi:trans-2,3-dihydro-3-hydroxyanthranilate isomerase
VRKIVVKQVDAFTNRPFFGNPAGVVGRAEGLSDREMQWIAREMNCSETAFVLPSSVADLRLRYFTPAIEVDLCGHATIAALAVLHEEGRVTGTVTVETRAGVLAMEVDSAGVAWMEQATPKVRAIDPDDVSHIVRWLGLERNDLHPDIPLGLAFTGLWDLLVPVRDRSALRRAVPDGPALAAYTRRLGAVSAHLFCFETEYAESTLHARDFSPAVGVLEDPHTGTASGALAAYLVEKGVLTPGRFQFEQGWTVGRPGLILVEVHQHPWQVRVGGQATTVLEGEIRLD